MEKYVILDRLGYGAHGTVYKMREKDTGNIVAVKKIAIFEDEVGLSPTALREVTFLKLLQQSPYIVRLLDIEHKIDKRKRRFYLILEFLSTDLIKFIQSFEKPNFMPPEMVQSLMYQLLKGVSHCHAHGVIHRDLKPENLLLDKEHSRLKIADLGLARAVTAPHRSYTHEVVTFNFKAPELLLGCKDYSMAVDMWSVGCIFAEMVTGEMLFNGSVKDQLGLMFKLLGKPTEKQWPGVTSLANWPRRKRKASKPKKQWPGITSLPNWTRHKSKCKASKPKNLARKFPALGTDGIDLLSKMLQIVPKYRISAMEVGPSVF